MNTSVSESTAMTRIDSTCAMGKVCFTNGVYLCAERRFVPWSECREYDTWEYDMAMTDRDYTLDACPPMEHTKEAVKEAFLKSPFRSVFDSDASPLERLHTHAEAQATRFLRRLARAVAGHVEDRVCVSLVGRRSSGKGVLMEMIANCFGSYVKHAPSHALQLPRTNHGDAAKANGWMASLADARVVYCNEVSHSTPMDTQALMPLCSGGEPVVVRTPFTNEKMMTLEGTLFLMGNAEPTWEADAVTPNLETFRTVDRFYTWDEIEKAPNESARQRMKLADPHMKSLYCKDRHMMDAFTQLVFDHYEA